MVEEEARTGRGVAALRYLQKERAAKLRIVAASTEMRVLHFCLLCHGGSKTSNTSLGGACVPNATGLCERLRV